jgi:hypothetical protein
MDSSIIIYVQYLGIDILEVLKKIKEHTDWPQYIVISN